MNLYCNGRAVLKDYKESVSEDLRDMLESGCGNAEDLKKWKAREKQRRKLRKQQ